MNARNLARTMPAASSEPLTATGQESHNPLAIHVTFAPEATAQLPVRRQNTEFTLDCRSDWQNPLNDF
jgi:hypothetical protein